MSESIKDLVDAGKILEGTELFWKRNREGSVHLAVIENGYIKTADGKVHKSPSGAARHLNGNKPIDGWKCWRIRATKKLIDELRMSANNQFHF